MSRVRIPIFCYHSMNVTGNSYASNDHIALERDIAKLKQLSYTILPLSRIAGALLNGTLDGLPKKVAGISCDDGFHSDYYSMRTPEGVELPGFYSIFRRHGVVGTAFLIASPEARRQLNDQNFQGFGKIDDSWWREAIRGGYLEFGNHSWDHNHPDVDPVAQRNQEKGNFFAIDSGPDAERQISQAHQQLQADLEGGLKPLFAYPYGHVNDFLRRHFLPGNRVGIEAAFSTEPAFVTEDTDRWCIPRFVCGHHWRSEDDFLAIVS